MTTEQENWFKFYIPELDRMYFLQGSSEKVHEYLKKKVIGKGRFTTYLVGRSFATVTLNARNACYSGKKKESYDFEPIFLYKKEQKIIPKIYRYQTPEYFRLNHDKRFYKIIIVGE